MHEKGASTRLPTSDGSNNTPSSKDLMANTLSFFWNSPHATFEKLCDVTRTDARGHPSVICDSIEFHTRTGTRLRARFFLFFSFLQHTALRLKKVFSWK